MKYRTRNTLLAGAAILAILLSGCAAKDENPADSAETSVEETGADTETAENSPEEAAVEIENENETEPEAPTMEEVYAMREIVLEGMSEEEIERLTNHIKSVNLGLEQGYLNENLFEQLEDPDSLLWNYFDQTGEIQIGWSYEGDIDKNKVMEEENLSEDEFYQKYGTTVIAYNDMDAAAFIDLMEELKESVNNEALKNDLQSIMDEAQMAADNHEMEHVNNLYKLVHDMDYFLLRYGIGDVGSYVSDASTISKYYGVLSVYD